MGEVTSFRQARAPQRSAEDEGKRLALPETAQIGEWLDAGDNARENASAYLADRDLDTATRFAIGAEEAEAEAAILARLRSFDRELLRNGNAADWDDLAENFEELFDGDPENVVERDSWGALFERLSDTLVAILLARGDPALGADVVRLLLVMGLVRAEVEAAAALDADAVFSALRWRTIALPPGVLLLPSVMRSILARRPGVSDLYVVREEWNRYEPGEIAHIENVLQGEVKRSIIEKGDYGRPRRIDNAVGPAGLPDHRSLRAQDVLAGRHVACPAYRGEGGHVRGVRTDQGRHASRRDLRLFG